MRTIRNDINVLAIKMGLIYVSLTISSEQQRKTHSLCMINVRIYWICSIKIWLFTISFHLKMKLDFLLKQFIENGPQSLNMADQITWQTIYVNNFSNYK